RVRSDARVRARRRGADHAAAVPPRAAPRTAAVRRRVPPADAARHRRPPARRRGAVRHRLGLGRLLPGPGARGSRHRRRRIAVVRAGDVRRLPAAPPADPKLRPAMNLLTLFAATATLAAAGCASTPEPARLPAITNAVAPEPGIVSAGRIGAADLDAL